MQQKNRDSRQVRDCVVDGVVDGVDDVGGRDEPAHAKPLQAERLAETGVDDDVVGKFGGRAGDAVGEEFVVDAVDEDARAVAGGDLGDGDDVVLGGKLHTGVVKVGEDDEFGLGGDAFFRPRRD